MSVIYVNFTDGTKTVIGTTFGAPQDPADWPFYAEISTGDARYVAWYDAQPPWAQIGCPAPD